jgi:hypothetical protein
MVRIQRTWRIAASTTKNHTWDVRHKIVKIDAIGSGFGMMLQVYS